MIALIKSRVEYTKNLKWKHLYRCYCGVEFIAIGADVNSGRVVSCGCYSKKQAKLRLTTHGLSKSTEHRAWVEMKRRCYAPNRPGYANWGGRGIKVCQRWLDSFDNFLQDMGKRPSKDYSLDRINNDKDYQPDNCRWADRKTQSQNQRRHAGKTFEES